MNYKFNLLNKCYDVISYYEKLLINYPKNSLVLKQNIESTCYSLVENLFAYNINDTERVKQKYLKDYLVKLAMLDYYTRISYDKKIISKRQFQVLGRKFIEIKKISFSIIKKSADEND